MSLREEIDVLLSWTPRARTSFMGGPISMRDAFATTTHTEARAQVEDIESLKQALQRIADEIDRLTDTKDA